METAHAPTRTRRVPRVYKLALLLGLAALVASACETNRSDAEAMINIINNERYARGIPLVVENIDLAVEADRWAAEMRNSCTLKHRPNLATGLPPGWNVVAENVGVGGSIWDVHNAFMASSDHRGHILNSGFTNLGVGVVWGNCFGSHQVWIVEIFIRIP
jgi:uncharacterized protein YkwD